MPDLLLELFSEEIPARMQRQAADDLKRLVTDALVERGPDLRGRAGVCDAAPAGAARRRPARRAAGPARGAQGPARRRAGGAIQGFLKSAGLARIEDAKIETDAKKGEFYVAVDREARPRRRAKLLADIAAADPARLSLAEIDALGRGLGPARRAALGAPAALDRLHLRRPARDAGDRAVRVDGIAAGDVTYGHRFMAPEAINVRRFEDYVAALAKAKVVLDADRRKDIILPTRAASPSRKGSNWSRTRACSTRSPAWSNGRSC